jgi:predicted lactoylglutathione lyase
MRSITTAGMALPVILTSRGSVRTAGCSSGSEKALSKVVPRMSVSSPMARPQVDAAYAAAMAAGATEIHPPGPQLHYDPRYYAAQVCDPDGYSLEFVYKEWQH